MALVLTEEQTMLRDSARGFMTDSGPVSQLRKLRDTQDADGFSRATWQRFADMGFTGVLVPEALGGTGLGYVEAGIVMEEIGRNLTASPFLASGVVAVTALRHGGSDVQQAALLPAIASGDRVLTLAVDERTKHAPHHITLQATKSATNWLLNGAKNWVLHGHIAHQLIVVARTSGGVHDQAGITLFLVDCSAPGIAIENVRGVDAQSTARIAFTNVAVPETSMLGVVDNGWPTLQAALNAGRVAAASEMLGIAEEVLARTLLYLKARKQFDRVIGEFQALQHRAAMLYCDIELSRSAVLKALQGLDASTENATATTVASVAKAHAGKTVTRAVQEGVQLHGGMGMTDEFEIGFFMKRARVLQELFGDANFHMNQLALLKQY